MATRHDIPMGLRGAYLSMHRQTNVLLSRSGITADQFVLLALLEEDGGITQQQLVRRADSDPNTVRAMLVLLERRGLVSRQPHPTDGRARKVALTRKGKAAAKRSLAVTQGLRDRLYGLFSPEETASLAKFLHRISECMSQSQTVNPSLRGRAVASRGPAGANP
ncbi:MAG: MarR family transcriptional regulator [Phycisphaerae bacterium]|nr:MarR family transcriptional regulator [Phycisphaerae bacterium]